MMSGSVDGERMVDIVYLGFRKAFNAIEFWLFVTNLEIGGLAR